MMIKENNKLRDIKRKYEKEVSLIRCSAIADIQRYVEEVCDANNWDLVDTAYDTYIYDREYGELIENCTSPYFLEIKNLLNDWWRKTFGGDIFLGRYKNGEWL